MSDPENTPEFLELPSSPGTDSQPKYERLRQHLIAEIAAGRLAPGTSLPSEQHFAQSLKLARSTVRQAMAALEQDGLILRVHGKGTFVHEDAPQRLRPAKDLFALVVPQTQVGYYPALQQSFAEAASTVGNQVIVCNTDDDIDKQGNAILQLIDHHVAGVALVPTTSLPTPAFHIRLLQEHGIPVVCCSRRPADAMAPLLAIPFEQIGQLAAETILQAGHRRLVYIGASKSTSAESYERGLRAGLQQAPAGSVDLQVYYSQVATPHAEDHEEEFQQVLQQILLKTNAPTAIFTSFDSFAELIYVLLARMGLRAPEDISLIGVGGTQRSGALLSRLTSVTIDECAMGQQAAELLSAMRRGEQPLRNSDMRTLPIGISDGRSLARPRSLVTPASDFQPDSNGLTHRS